MANPLDNPLPPTVIDRARELALDLAYGIDQGWWDTYIDEWLLIEKYVMKFGVLATKWGKNLPRPSILVTLGYLEAINSRDGVIKHDAHTGYMLTEKALHLLDEPAAPPTIFISYRRSVSSALGLLIEARLKLAGNPNPFLDKNLVAGDEWQDELEVHVKGARYVVCLIGKRSLESPYVLKEIEWAIKYNCTIIAVWHDGAQIDDTTPEYLTSRHAIFVKNESALDYEVAVNQLLNSLGYATY